MKKLRVGVTGGIGSGKSSFCNYIAEKKIPVIYADDLAKNILQSDALVKKKVIDAFGAESYKEGELNKKFLANVVFSDPENTQLINSIVHPAVSRAVEKLVSEEHKKNDLVFVEAALIYEAEMEEMFDYVVLIKADNKIKKERVQKRDNVSAEEVERRQENQIPDEEKAGVADFVFENNGSVEELKTKADLLINLLNGILRTK
jgi:dephospho-CoA kinase